MKPALLPYTLDADLCPRAPASERTRALLARLRDEDRIHADVLLGVEGAPELDWTAPRVAVPRPLVDATTATSRGDLRP